MPDTDQDPRDVARHQVWRDQTPGGWRCPGCGRGRGEVTRVDVHHRDGRPRNNDPDNLVALCKRCHLGGAHGRDVDEDQLSPPEPRGTGTPTPRDLGPP